MEELVNQIKEASQKLVNEYSVQDITIYIDEDVSSTKRVRVSVDL